MGLESPSELLSQLVSIPSVNPVYGGTGEADLASFVAEWLSRNGIEPEMQEALPGRMNVVARIGDSRLPALLLEAHMDTVGVEGWQVGDPFAMSQSEGRLYGRGTCDTKGSLAAFMLTAAQLAQNWDDSRMAIVFCASVDEENLQIGAYRMAERMREMNIRFAITGEPTGNRIVNRHKGVCRYVVTCRGEAAHGSTPHLGKNAIYDAARLCLEYERLNLRLQDAQAVPEIERGALNIGTISGGIGFNVVPDCCRFEIDRRLGVTEALEKARRELRAIALTMGGELEAFLERPPLVGKDSAEFADRMVAASHTVGWKADILDASYMTNAVAYEELGVPALVFGPGNIAQAHKVDEYIEVGEIERCISILGAFLRQG